MQPSQNLLSERDDVQDARMSREDKDVRRDAGAVLVRLAATLFEMTS